MSNPRFRAYYAIQALLDGFTKVDLMSAEEAEEALPHVETVLQECIEEYNHEETEANLRILDIWNNILALTKLRAKGILA